MRSRPLVSRELSPRRHGPIPPLALPLYPSRPLAARIRSAKVVILAGTGRDGAGTGMNVSDVREQHHNTEQQGDRDSTSSLDALPPIPAPPASLLQPVRRVTISTCGRAPLLGRSCVRKAGSKWRDLRANVPRQGRNL